jgi:hypothetical protein
MRELFIEGVYVYERYDIPHTKTIITRPLYLERRIDVSVDKPTITAAGTEFTTVTFEWERFNVESEAYLPDTACKEVILVDVAGTKAELPVTDGKATLEFDASVPGKFTIQSENPSVENGQVEVVAQ